MPRGTLIAFQCIALAESGFAGRPAALARRTNWKLRKPHVVSCRGIFLPLRRSIRDVSALNLTNFHETNSSALVCYVEATFGISSLLEELLSNEAVA